MSLQEGTDRGGLLHIITAERVQSILSLSPVHDNWRREQRSRVRYRGSLASAAFGLWEGFAVLSIGWPTTSAYHDGVFDQRYGVLMAVPVAMGVTYERFGAYAWYDRFTNETIALVKAWWMLLPGCLSSRSRVARRPSGPATSPPV